MSSRVAWQERSRSTWRVAARLSPRTPTSMSVSLPTTPLAAPPTLEIDLGGSASHSLERDGLHDSPASLASLSHQQQQQPSGGSRAGPVPHSGAPNSDTASFIDLGDDAKLPHSPSDSSSALSQTQRIFAQLDRIKLIQSRIAHTHSTLERIPAIAALAAAEAPRAGAAPPPATMTPDKEGGLGLGDRTKEQRERVAKAYEESAEAFARRDEGVEGIMAQVRRRLLSSLQLSVGAI